MTAAQLTTKDTKSTKFKIKISETFASFVRFVVRSHIRVDNVGSLRQKICVKCEHFKE